MKCSDVVERVSDIVDEEANIVTRMRFYGHLMMCSHCRRYFRQFKSIKETTGKVLRDELPEDFDRVMNFVMDKIEKENEHGKTDAQRKKP